MHLKNADVVPKIPFNQKHFADEQMKSILCYF